MIQCISWMKRFFIRLWQTLKKYVCKRKHIYMKDVDNDSIPELVLDPNGLKDNEEPNSHNKINDKEVK